MKIRSIFMVLVGGRLGVPRLLGATDSPTRFIYGFKYKRRIYQWNVPDRLNFNEE